MSKSNLKNINSLTSTKTPYILYLNSTYTNLLYKLKKSTNWCYFNQRWLNKSINEFRDNTNFFMLINENEMWLTYVLIKKNFVKYNPNTVSILFTPIELSFINNYKYIDVDVLEYLKKLNRIKLKQIKNKQINV